VLVSIEKEWIMADLIIHTELAERLRAIAEREQRQVEDVLADLVTQYESQAQDDPAEEERAKARAEMAGMFDVDITDLSTTVRETMEAYYRNKYGRPD
jgi:hypothetical protein